MEGAPPPASPSTRRDLRRVLAVLGALAVAAALTLMAGWWQVMAPAPTPALSRSPRRAPLPTRTAPAREGVTVVVRDAEGRPAAGVDVLLRAVDTPPTADGAPAPTPAGTTDATGRLRLVLDGPASVSLAATAVPSAQVARPGDPPLAFTLVDACPVDAQVVDSAGAPVAGVTVRAKVLPLPGSRAAIRTSAPTDDRGVASLSGMGCGVAELWVRADGHALVRRRDVDTVVERSVLLTLVRGVVVEGQVTDETGQPVHGARVNGGEASDITDEDGLYGLRVDPARLTHVVARAPGHSPHSGRLRIPPDEPGPVLHDIVLETSRMVTVWCAGMPDDSCAGIAPIFCTRPLLPTGTECTAAEGGPLTCRCPEGAAAVRGGGTNSAVGADDTEAWLDLRDRGGITGRVLRGGQPVACNVRGTRLPAGLEDIPGGLAAGTVGRCDPDGRYTMTGMKAGNWMVSVETGGEVRNLDAIAVDGGLADAGTLELRDGGTIRGVVLDGATGEGQPGATVVAISDDTALPRVGHATSGTEGSFAIMGLQDGRYEVFLANQPFERVPVEVPLGDDTQLTLETGEAALLDRNGFGLATDEDGSLVVDQLDPEGPAAAAGLEEGDVVVGVTVGGMDVGELAPGLARDVTDFVLDRWSGPGAGLVVDRDGERHTVDLD